MKHADCTGCGLPVLELESQFELMQPYEIQNGEVPVEQAGHWHTACLVASPSGTAWAAVRLRTYTQVRGYQVTSELPRWTVLAHERGDRVALGKTGERIELARLGSKKKSRKAEGGRVFPKIDEGYNLDLKDSAPIDAVRAGFASEGAFPLIELFGLLGIADRVHHPEALERGVISSIRETTSRHFITMRVEYGVFVPDELL